MPPVTRLGTPSSIGSRGGPSGTYSDDPCSNAVKPSPVDSERQDEPAVSDVARHSRCPTGSHGGPSWWAITGTVASSVGLALTPVWLYLPDRDWSSPTAYFDPWYNAAIPLAMLVLGPLLSLFCIGYRRPPPTPRWVAASRWLSGVGGFVVVTVVLLVPFVIWLAKLLAALVTALVAAWLWLNRRRIMSGRLPYVPRSLASWVRLTEKAAEIGPHIR